MENKTTKELLQEAKTQLANLQAENWFELDDEALNFVMDYKDNSGGDYGIDRVYEEDIDQMVLNEAQEGGAFRIKHLLYEASENPTYGWRIDGYGNICDITKNDIEVALSDIITELERELGE